MKASELNNLIEKVNSGAATDQEMGLYNAYMNRLAKKHAKSPTIPPKQEDHIREELWHRIHIAIATVHKQPVNLWQRTSIAAAILITVTIGSYFVLFNNKQNTIIEDKQQALQHDIHPGGTKALLTLANGQHIVLDKMPNGQLATQGHTTISKTTNGQIIYHTESNASKAVTSFNTIATPKGGTYTITLSDGSKVWLNAASSIKYPVEFSGNERRVEITGEVYFEIAHNKAKPFRVITGEQIVEVLGTHFNINAYPEEKTIRTTLISGSIKISNGAQSTIIKPGQQSQLTDHHLNIIDHTDIAQAIAWKEGFFRMQNCDLQEIMRQIARWYDVDIVYQGNIPPIHFTGEIRRNVNVSDVLHMLSYFDVNFNINGRRITVYTSTSN